MGVLDDSKKNQWVIDDSMKNVEKYLQMPKEERRKIIAKLEEEMRIENEKRKKKM